MEISIRSGKSNSDSVGVGALRARGRPGPGAARRGIRLAQRDIDHPAGREPQSLGDQVEVVVVDPDRGKIVRYSQRQGVARGLEAHDGLEPHLEDVFRKERLEVALYRLPEARSEGR